jgi:hypothetical protein
MRRRWPWLVLALAVVAVGVAMCLLHKTLTSPDSEPEGYEPLGPPGWNEPLARVVKDDRPPFRIDPTKSWQLEFGRGSALHGFYTIKIDQSGHLSLFRPRLDTWQTATAQLPPAAVAEVLLAVEANRLLELDRKYMAEAFDGIQWLLWIRQGEREKSVYFDNHFPDQIVRFVERLEEIISDTVGAHLRWLPIAGRDHDRDLWNSSKR